MARSARLWIGTAVAATAIAGGAAWWAQRADAPGGDDPRRLVRRMLWFELQPVRLARCELQRFGEAHDGGYLLCGNLLGAVEAGYSYGISGTTAGAAMSRRDWKCRSTNTTASTRRARSAPGRTVFHDECVAATPATIEGRTFGTMAHQLDANGHGTAHVVLKMDVEGAEWASFLEAPPQVLDRIDQLVVEFHGTDERRFVMAVRRLKQWFYVANVHMNNHSCQEGHAPFPAWAYEVLFVSKRLDTIAPGAPTPTGTHPLETPNTLAVADCQPSPVP